MIALRTPFLSLLFLILAVSIDNFNGLPRTGVSAAPLIGDRVSTEGKLLERSPRPEPFRNPRVGIVVKTGQPNPATSARDVQGGSRAGVNAIGRRSSFQDVEAGKGGLIVPLRHLPPRGEDAGLVLQVHLNRAVSKLARMTARAAPTSEELFASLARRREQSIFSANKRYFRPHEGEHPLPRAEHSPPLPSQRAAAVGQRKRAPEPEPVKFAKGKHGRIGVVIQHRDSEELGRRLLDSLTGLLGGSESAAASAASTAKAGVTAAKASSSCKAKSAPQAAPTTSKTITEQKSNAAAPSKKSAADADGSAGYPKAALDAAAAGGLKNASSPSAQQSLGLDIEANDVGYVATIQIGSENTPFRMLVDSGSADTWVGSTKCDNCSGVHQKLGKSVSKTFQGTTNPFSITYGTGSVSGILGRDDVYIAGMKLANQTLGLARKETTDFSDPGVPFDGLMGLAKQELANSKSPTPIDALYSAKLVPAPVMGYHLGRASDADNDGEVTFGGVDASKYRGALKEVGNVSKQGFWEINLDGVTYDGKKISSISGTGKSQRTAILDTGTTLIVAPQADADAVHNAIKGSKPDGQGGYTIPCTTSGKLSFSFGGQDWEMRADDMKFLPVDSNNLKGDCISAISSGDVGQANEWLVGAAFLKNVYLATNTKSNSVGLATLT
ncbi:acid protease [Ceraceosorus guamensis]|uniref:Acid protease n=1 Tax=Ceraceosorus guamensis TaxID=1522189 RepID=A0A316VXM0_9BASI|nr:acid protease [Ceraceosorus guamensis]PWN42199.1 acid protease [Ceraceosorus guamensis]